MQFLVYDTNQNPESGTPPSPELLAEMGKGSLGIAVVEPIFRDVLHASD